MVGLILLVLLKILILIKYIILGHRKNLLSNSNLCGIGVYRLKLLLFLYKK